MPSASSSVYGFDSLRSATWPLQFVNSDAHELQSRSRSIALSIAEALRSPKQLERAVARSLFQTALPSQRHWVSFSTAQGYAGISLLYAHLSRCFPQSDWQTPAIAYFDLAVSGALVHSSIPMGALTGLAGLFFVGRYLEVFSGIELEATKYLEHRLSAVSSILAEKVLDACGVAVSDVDIVSGLSGVSIVLQTFGRKASEASSTSVLDALASLTREHDGIPNLHCPAHLSNPQDSIAKQFPNGFVNFGLAHGIAGPLFALSLASLSSTSATYILAARDLGQLLNQARGHDKFGPNWPAAVELRTFESQAANYVRTAEVITRTAWCYGNPGVCRALKLAAEATHSGEFHQSSLAGIRSSLQRPWPTAISSPTFCHGIAGFLQALLRFAAEEQSADLLGAAQQCALHLVGMYDQSSPLGYCSVELGDLRVDQPGLLDGAAGVALALLSFSEPIEPMWDRLFAVG